MNSDIRPTCLSCGRPLHVLDNNSQEIESHSVNETPVVTQNMTASIKEDNIDRINHGNADESNIISNKNDNINKTKASLIAFSVGIILLFCFHIILAFLDVKIKGCLIPGISILVTYGIMRAIYESLSQRGESKDKEMGSDVQTKEKRSGRAK